MIGKVCTWIVFVLLALPVDLHLVQVPCAFFTVLTCIYFGFSASRSDLFAPILSANIPSVTSRLRDSQLEQLNYWSLLGHYFAVPTVCALPASGTHDKSTYFTSPQGPLKGDKFLGLTSAPRSHPSISNNFSKPKIAFHVDEGDLSPTPMDSVTSHHSLRASSCPGLWRTVEDILHVDVNVSSGNVLYSTTAQNVEK